MTKIRLFLTFLLLLTMIFTSCEVFLPDVTTEPECIVHIWSDYKYNERVHWREYTCGCPWPEIVEEHINFDKDLLCDVCGAYCDCEHSDEDVNHICDICGIDLID